MQCSHLLCLSFRGLQMQHAADAEMGLTRTLMQTGEYRRALTFAAHTAAAHRANAGGTALYAWLLFIGGQRVEAQRVLDQANGVLPDDPLLVIVRRQLAAETPFAGDALLTPPARLPPYGSTRGLPPSARVIGTGILSTNGTRVLVPIATLVPSLDLWVRNGLGDLRRVRVERRLVDLHIAVLRVDQALPQSPPPALAKS